MELTIMENTIMERLQQNYVVILIVIFCMAQYYKNFVGIFITIFPSV